MESVGVNPEKWRNMRVLVTGHTGFKGSWLTLWLSKMGADVAGFALDPPTTPSLYDALRLNSAITDWRGDIRNRVALSEAIESHRPTVVFHLAAQPLVRRSYTDPVLTFEANVTGTVNVLEAVRHAPTVRAVVVVTTDKCYENREWLWGYREHEALGGEDPYSSSKACAELVTHAYRRSFLSRQGVGVATARAGNVIGGGDWAEDRLLPDLMRGAVEGKTVRIRNPSAVRPWQHVLDSLQGYLTLAEHLLENPTHYAEAWNFGPAPEDAQPVSWVAGRAQSRWSAIQWEVDAGEHPHEAHVLRLDSSKSRTKLGWYPRLNLNDALALTVDWYKAHATGEDALALSVAQLERYQNGSGEAAKP